MLEPYLLWDPAQVAVYLLRFVDVDIVDLFIENNIDGSLLPFLTTEHLRELGIVQLSLRLRVKQAIKRLIHELFEDESAIRNSSLNRLNSINIDSNYVSLEAVTLCSKILQDMPPPATSKEVCKLEGHFRKLKADLGSVLRLATEAKPLPVPTLDPGPPKSLPTYTSGSAGSALLSPDRESDSSPKTSNFQLSSAVRGSLNGKDSPEYSSDPMLQRVQSTNTHSRKHPAGSKSQELHSPSHSHRWSSASVLTTGVGKLADIKQIGKLRVAPKLHLVDAPHPEPEQTSPDGLHSATFRRPLKSKRSLPLINTAHSRNGRKYSHPLQVFKASSEDTGLKLLQSAIRKNNIPKEDWSRYALVICYDDKERIVKLNEKPVSIFKDLQEQGKNPTIMLRELNLSTDNPYDDNSGEETIPGGML